MRVSFRTILVPLVVLLGVPVVFVAASWLYFAAISETRVSWDTPHSREEVLATDFGMNLGLPLSAKDIFAFYRNEGTQQNLVYIRFTATPDDIESFIQREFERHRRIFPNEQLLRAPITKHSFSELPWAITRPRWWTPQSIAVGTYITIDSGLGARFWIDSATNTLYYYDFS